MQDMAVLFRVSKRERQSPHGKRRSPCRVEERHAPTGGQLRMATRPRAEATGSCRARWTCVQVLTAGPRAGCRCAASQEAAVVSAAKAAGWTSRGCPFKGGYRPLRHDADEAPRTLGHAVRAWNKGLVGTNANCKAPSVCHPGRRRGRGHRPASHAHLSGLQQLSWRRPRPMVTERYAAVPSSADGHLENGLTGPKRIPACRSRHTGSPKWCAGWMHTAP